MDRDALHPPIRHRRLGTRLALPGLPFGVLSLLACLGGPLPAEALDPVEVEVLVEAQGFEATQVEQLLAQPLEAGLVQLPGLSTLSSSSTLAGVQLRLRFVDTTDPFEARQATAAALSTVQLPEETLPPVILGAPEEPILSVLLSGADLTEAAVRLSELQDQLQRVPGISRAHALVDPTPRLVVELEAQRLQARGVSPARVEAVLSEAFFDLRPGLRTPAPPDPEDLGALMLAPGLRLEDLATIGLEGPPAESLPYLTETGPVAVLQVYASRAPGSPGKGTEQAREQLLNQLVTIAGSTPGATPRLESRRQVVQLHGVDAEAGRAALTRADLGEGYLWVPGEPAELWTWSAEAQTLALLVNTKIPGLEARAVVPEDHTVLAVVTGPDREVLARLAEALLTRVEGLPGVVGATRRSGPPAPELDLRLNREVLAQLGLSQGAVLGALRSIDGSAVSGGWPAELRVTGLGSLEEPDTVKLLLDTPDGLQLLPLSALATIELRAVAGRLDRVDGQVAELVQIDLSEAMTRVPTALEEAVRQLELPVGITVRLAPCPRCP